MPTYQAPLRDMRFVLYELHNGGDLAKLNDFNDFTPDVIDPVLNEAAKLCQEVLHPLNLPADDEGCHWDNGVVRTPKGFKEAYNLFREGGWPSLASDPAYGGQGMPKSVNLLMEEMICSANLSFGMYPGLTHGAYTALHGYASDELKNAYLPKMVEGTWSGTMCLTEPHCGTDLGLLRTKAVPQDDGSYKISGTKIFITSGEHDLTENIIHLVLAKLPDAPKGVKGISLFLVPKFMPKADGTPGMRNGVTCASIEHKMGIKASASCMLVFEDAVGYLVGEPHKGMRAMFAMMNTERVSVGVQGLGLAEVSYQNAVAYAKERLQGRALSGAKYPDKPADPLIVHPDIRRMLLTQRAWIEGCRALSGWAAKALDESKHHPDEVERIKAEDRVAVITPVVKAMMTDMGFEVTNLGVQVFGGHGYIHDNGMEQYVRDARITQIYEGTNGVQALDLVGRKMPAHAGRYLRSVFHPISNYIEAKIEKDGMTEFVEPLAKAFGRLQQATAQVATVGLSKPEEAGAAATDYLRLMGYTVVAYMWTQMAELSLAKVGTDDPEGFYKAKLSTARFFMERLLPQATAHFQAVMAGGKTMMAFDDAHF
ncbi:acyl-CoA dehydrogenase C-terminal domain-containing protein [Aestuariivirga litoralis]|uniref:acyl-CoA dehydrogenase C-terminal domain-containing protein n=1 Tax=Aestuariivirga litoralis TaxID=2650924 RepID=UPI0018C6B752|nr:acyl-CoA dehydrogenase C-terminal domain-containing protein [Aestuariivirga litoralis]MBG1232586.1 acyl-CoA dehydrogenase [Aestuariivirga litoralis]